MQYTHLTSEERYTIWTLRKVGCSGGLIAKMLGRSRSTISRELRRNVSRRGYRPRRAHGLALERRRVCRKPTKLTAAVKQVLAPLLFKRWSPEQIAGRLRREGRLSISHETIYKFIALNKEKGGRLYRFLRRSKRYRRRNRRQPSPYQESRKSIDERPASVDARDRIGDWEIDTLVSRANAEVLLSLVERKSRYTLIGKQPNKESWPMAKRVVSMLRRHKDKVKTITSDNGTEFASFRQIENRLEADFYFAHPYSSWERGTNENTNGLIREYFPKASGFASANPDRLAQVMYNLNNRPRKVLGYRTPKEAFSESVALVY